MKWFFFLLLLVNIGVFIWIYPQNNKPETVTTLPAGVERLVLLAEVAPVTDAGGIQDSPPSLPVGSDQSTGERDADNATQLPLPVETQAEISETDRMPEQGAEMAQALEEPVSEEVERLAAEEPAEQEAVEVSATEETEAEMQCQTLGPLLKRAEADNLSVRLRSMGLEPELHSETRNEQAGYWVMIPPQANRAQALDVVKRLEEKGITDLWRFTSGNLAHAVSLGLFRDEARANIRREEIIKKGFDATVQPRFRQQTLYWLRYGFTGKSPVSETRWEEIIKRFPDIERVSVECEKIATQ